MERVPREFPRSVFDARATGALAILMRMYVNAIADRCTTHNHQRPGKAPEKL